jgi:hypothetical protein
MAVRVVTSVRGGARALEQVWVLSEQCETGLGAACGVRHGSNGSRVYLQARGVSGPARAFFLLSFQQAQATVTGLLPIESLCFGRNLPPKAARATEKPNRRSSCLHGLRVAANRRLTFSPRAGMLQRRAKTGHGFPPPGAPGTASGLRPELVSPATTRASSSPHAAKGEHPPAAHAPTKTRLKSAMESIVSGLVCGMIIFVFCWCVTPTHAAPCARARAHHHQPASTAHPAFSIRVP